MRTDEIPSRVNMMFVAAIATANGALFVGLPLASLSGPLLWSALVPLVLATVPHWGLIHEAIHRHLHRDARTNEAAGRLLGILFLAPFDALRFGHLSHHALNANPSDRPELFDPELMSRPRAALVFYPRLLFGIYAAEMLSGLVSLLPRRWFRPIVRAVFYEGQPDAARMADRAERHLLDPVRLRRIRQDALASMGLVTIGVVAWGSAWPVLALALVGRGMVVSVLDNAPHYGGAMADPEQGYDMRLARPLAPLVLNANLHGTHHRHPTLPWTALPAAFAADGGRYAGSYFLLPWRQLRGPLRREQLPLDPGPP